MKIKFSDKQLVDLNFQAMILPIYSDEKLSGQAKVVDKKLGGWISEIIKDGYFTPELGEVHVVYSYEKLKVKKIVLVGLGKKKDLNMEGYNKAISLAIIYVGKTSIRSCAIYVGNKNEDFLRDTVEITLLSLYRFHHHKSKKKDTKLSQIDFVYDGQKDITKLNDIVKSAQNLIEGIYLARDLTNHPSNIINPKKLAEEAKNIAKECKNISVKIYDESKITEMGMGLFASVARGSDEDARMIVLDYRPRKYNKTIAFVGKGLTFDSGGISIKPSEHMELMKMDMAGSASVLGAFQVISKMNPKNIRIIGAIGACENLPGHKAQKPGDIWKAYNGKTVEVINTDAEGRLVLADVLSYIGKQYKPNYMIDLATLTGACMIALGFEYTAVFGNNQSMIEKAIDRSKNSYEKLWQLPMDNVHHEEMKSSVADLQNLGKGSEGGASTAAAFLEEFVDPKIKWMHMDIAGSAIQIRPTKPYIQKGGSGAGVKTLIEFVKSLG